MTPQPMAALGAGLRRLARAGDDLRAHGLAGHARDLALDRRGARELDAHDRLAVDGERVLARQRHARGPVGAGHGDEPGRLVGDDREVEGALLVGRRARHGPGDALDGDRRAGHGLVAVGDGAADAARRREDERYLGRVARARGEDGAAHEALGIVVGVHARAPLGQVREGRRVADDADGGGRRDEADGCRAHGVALGVEDAAADLGRAVLGGRKGGLRSLGDGLDHRGEHGDDHRIGKERPHEQEDDDDRREDERRDDGRHPARETPAHGSLAGLVISDGYVPADIR